ncbi:MAG: hypothetical protein U0575_11670 [Phycisphaerales bacterium]
MTLSQNYEYALTCYASGIKLDPGNMDAHRAMWEAAVQYFSAGGKPATGKEIKAIDGPGPVDRFAAAEFAWMKDLNNVSLAIKALEAAAKAQQIELGRWIAPRIKNIVFKQLQQKRSSKSVLLQAKEAFSEVGAWDEAFQCGEQAVKLDPNDNALLAELKELTAQRAIHQGGYAQNAGTEGGFRGFVKDADKQRALEEQDALGGGADTDARNLERARREYEANPLSPEAVNKYAQLLKRSEEGEETAHAVYMKAFKELNEYRFRMGAGDIRIAQARRALKALREAMQAAPEEAEAKTAFEAQREKLLALEADEYRQRAERYPTDKSIRFELGRLEFERGNYEGAMANFQTAKEEARFRVSAAWMLGRCFAAESWHQEAIGEFREALKVLDASDKERELEIKYDLMASMLSVAREEQSLAMAKEAADICSTILRRNISFRDIRNKRKELDQLIRDLGGTAA